MQNSIYFTATGTVVTGFAAVFWDLKSWNLGRFSLDMDCGVDMIF